MGQVSIHEASKKMETEITHIQYQEKKTEIPWRRNEEGVLGELTSHGVWRTREIGESTDLTGFEGI